MIKLWVDDLRPAPQGYIPVQTVYDALNWITFNSNQIEEINLDHDAGDFKIEGGDYINILNTMENMCYNFPVKFNFLIKFHTANPIGRENMIRICKRNGWKYE